MWGNTVHLNLHRDKTESMYKYTNSYTKTDNTKDTRLGPLGDYALLEAPTSQPPLRLRVEQPLMR